MLLNYHNGVYYCHLVLLFMVKLPFGLYGHKILNTVLSRLSFLSKVLHITHLFNSGLQADSHRQFFVAPTIYLVLFHKHKCQRSTVPGLGKGEWEALTAVRLPCPLLRSTFPTTQLSICNALAQPAPALSHGFPPALFQYPPSAGFSSSFPLESRRSSWWTILSPLFLC